MYISPLDDSQYINCRLLVITMAQDEHICIREIKPFIFRTQRIDETISIVAYAPDRLYGQAYNEASLKIVTPLLNIPEMYTQIKETEDSSLKVQEKQDELRLTIKIQVGQTLKQIKMSLQRIEESQDNIQQAREMADIEYNLQQIGIRQPRCQQDIVEAKAVNLQDKKELSSLQKQFNMTEEKQNRERILFAKSSRVQELKAKRAKQQSIKRRLQSDLEQLNSSNRSQSPRPTKRGVCL